MDLAIEERRVEMLETLSTRQLGLASKPLVPPHLLSCVLYLGIVLVLCFLLFFLIHPLFGNRPTQHQPCPVGFVAI